MPLLFRYFWFLAAAVMLANVAIWRGRLAVAARRGIVTQAEADRFTRYLVLWFGGVPLLLGLVGLAAGWSSPFCAAVLSFADVPRTLASLVVVAGWVAVLWWIWRGGGAELLARIGPALGQRPEYDQRYSPALVRAVLTAMAIASGIGFVVTSRSMPLPPELACPASPAPAAR